MVSEQFLWCRNCGTIHHLTQPDKSPPDENLSSDLTQSTDAFKDHHAAHKLECLVAAGEIYFPTGQKTDLMAVDYIEVTNGQDRYLLRGGRRKLGQPLQFAVVKGCLAQPGFGLHVQEAALCKAMKEHFGRASAPFGDEKIERFISLVREVVKEVGPGSIQVTGYSTTDSNVVYGRFGEAELDALMKKCSSQFEDAEVESIRRFVEAHRETGDVMTVLMRRHISIETAA